MNRVACCYLLLFFVVAVPVDAAVFERDWKTPGDGLLTYDDVNRREWLDVPQSHIYQFPRPFLEPALAELAPGGRFEGFQWATGDDVIALAESAGVDTTRLIQNSGVPMRRLIELLWPPESSDRLALICCATDIHEQQVMVPSVYFLLRANPINEIVDAEVDIRPPGLIRLTGLMLYRQVPEPSSLVLLATASVILRARPRRRPGLKRSRLRDHALVKFASRR